MYRALQGSCSAQFRLGGPCLLCPQTPNTTFWSGNYFLAFSFHWTLYRCVVQRSDMTWVLKCEYSFCSSNKHSCEYFEHLLASKVLLAISLSGLGAGNTWILRLHLLKGFALPPTLQTLKTLWVAFNFVCRVCGNSAGTLYLEMFFHVGLAHKTTHNMVWRLVHDILGMHNYVQHIFFYSWLV